ncbi:hypothetical protein Vretimale_20014 [Volvox reticuliferus]|uniref:Uncharacterized protein n=2 Tax=Volvox reticuliferus TaxID=1737510 RepID=A0A8J4CYD0_9CHLO|nr:hypothetical protein Vretifemale_17760 [Volvox reticuliferus]GIM15309.1 hypothetical protein Vretimale_18094 [Volvox reticuliferus]GIM17463.1 hypothetical protein Vretimale_20014 [Volvox reticuliferus]
MRSVRVLTVPLECSVGYLKRLICKASGGALWPRTIQPMRHGPNQGPPGPFLHEGAGRAAVPTQGPSLESAAAAPRPSNAAESPFAFTTPHGVEAPSPDGATAAHGASLAVGIPAGYGAGSAFSQDRVARSSLLVQENGGPSERGADGDGDVDGRGGNGGGGNGGGGGGSGTEVFTSSSAAGSPARPSSAAGSGQPGQQTAGCRFGSSLTPDPECGGRQGGWDPAALAPSLPPPCQGLEHVAGEHHGDRGNATGSGTHTDGGGDGDDEDGGGGGGGGQGAGAREGEGGSGGLGGSGGSA